MSPEINPDNLQVRLKEIGSAVRLQWSRLRWTIGELTDFVLTAYQVPTHRGKPFTETAAKDAPSLRPPIPEFFKKPAKK